MRCACDHHYSFFRLNPKPGQHFPRHARDVSRVRFDATSAVKFSKQKKYTHRRARAHGESLNLLLLHDIFFDGAELLQSAGSQVPLVLLFQARVLLAQIVHLSLELIDATLLLLQQLLLGLDDVVELLQVLGRLARVFDRRVFHVAVREPRVHGDGSVDAAARSLTHEPRADPRRRALAARPLFPLLSRLRVKKLALQQRAVRPQAPRHNNYPQKPRCAGGGTRLTL